jgi:hypothetical protein
VSIQAQRQPTWFDDARRRCLLGDCCRQRSDVRGTRLYRSTFNGTVMVYDRVTEFGQGRAAALLASLLAGDDWDAKTSVQAVNKQPSSPVRHPHLPAGFGDRACLSINFISLILPGPTARPPSKSMRNVSLGMGLRTVWLRGRLVRSPSRSC